MTGVSAVRLGPLRADSVESLSCHQAALYDERMTTMTRPATPAETEANATKPAHKHVVTVQINTDARATVGRAHTIHRAETWTYLNSHGESVGRIVTVSCGAQRYRNCRSAATAAPQRYDVDCARCLNS